MFQNATVTLFDVDVIEVVPGRPGKGRGLGSAKSAATKNPPMANKQGETNLRFTKAEANPPMRNQRSGKNVMVDLD
jgi:hypothetical protein